MYVSKVNKPSIIYGKESENIKNQPEHVGTSGVRIRFLIGLDEGKEALNSNHLAASPVNLSCQTNFPRLTQLDFTQSLKYPPGVIDGQRMDKKSVPICENAIVDAKPQNPGKKLLA
ncbi:unnamed protein product [Allacma fusca]|uniref:Uncharacterized protein n=1 Tax=Allacma fusca TaxID=39272 RepID=A0A8J2NTE1_9HEXA|nr:unnamed protein product [Allacma fusca]